MWLVITKLSLHSASEFEGCPSVFLHTDDHLFCLPLLLVKWISIYPKTCIIWICWTSIFVKSFHLLAFVLFCSDEAPQVAVTSDSFVNLYLRLGAQVVAL